MIDNIIIHVGDVVQFDPETVQNKGFVGLFGIVNEIKPWGAVIEIYSVQGHRDTFPQVYYYRAQTNEFIHIGKAAISLTSKPGPEQDDRP